VCGRLLDRQTVPSKVIKIILNNSKTILKNHVSQFRAKDICTFLRHYVKHDLSIRRSIQHAQHMENSHMRANYNQRSGNSLNLSRYRQRLQSTHFSFVVTHSKLYEHMHLSCLIRRMKIRYFASIQRRLTSNDGLPPLKTCGIA
jgi:hypothetical protein